MEQQGEKCISFYLVCKMHGIKSLMFTKVFILFMPVLFQESLFYFPVELLRICCKIRFNKLQNFLIVYLCVHSLQCKLCESVNFFSVSHVCLKHPARCLGHGKLFSQHSVHGLSPSCPLLLNGAAEGNMQRHGLTARDSFWEATEGRSRIECTELMQSENKCPLKLVLRQCS